MLKTFVGIDFVHNTGQEYDLPDVEALRYIDADGAVLVRTKSPETATKTRRERAVSRK